MVSLTESQLSPELATAAFRQFQQSKIFTFIYAFMLAAMIPNFIYSVRLLLKRGRLTAAPLLCFFQSTCGLILMTIALFSYIYPLDDCRLQGRIIETFVIGVLVGLHSLLFVKAYYALQKPLWLLIMHVILELAFIGSVLMAAIGEAFIRLEVERACLSILPEDWLLVELVLDIVFNVFYSGTFLWVLKVQQNGAKSTHWKSLITDGLIYMFGITFSTTLLVTISIVNGPAKTGVLLFAVAAVVGSCLMTSQLWKSSTRTSQMNNTSFLSDELSKRSNQHGSSAGAGTRHELLYAKGQQESHELKTVNIKSGLECECECFCQFHNPERSRPESVLLQS